MKKLISLMLVLVMCTLALTSCGGANGSPEAVVESMMKVMTDFDVNGVKDLLPDEAWEEMYKEMDVDEDEFWEDMEDTFDEMKDSMEEADGYEIDYKIGDVEDMDEDEVEELNEELEDLLDDDIDAAAIVTVEMTITIEYEGEEMEMDEEMEYTVFKYDGKWYINPDDLDMF